MDQQTNLSKEFKTFTKRAKAYSRVKVCVWGGWDQNGFQACG